MSRTSEDEHIIDLLESISRKLDKVLKAVEPPRTPSQARSGLTDGEILRLQPRLQPTASALRQLRRGTAEDVSEVTRRGRAIESLYLNELVQIGIATKERSGRIAYFSLVKR
jgi:ArsR family transcriptional regulator, lead/cadmium/zinc/bismuth-responsive transcriptional repressor